MNDPSANLSSRPSPSDSTRDLHCPYCGYELHGLRERRCPECGRAFDPDVIRWLRQRFVRRGWPMAVAMLILVPPIGLVAFVYCCRMERARADHRYDAAYRLAGQVEAWNIASGFVGLVFYLTVPVLLAYWSTR